MTNGMEKLFKIKDSNMPLPGTEDMGFCSGEEEYSESINSPTDSSEDSVEVKISPISLKNKRKCGEPRILEEPFTGPLKKRMCLKVKAEVNESHPFRPWSPKSKLKGDNLQKNEVYNKPSTFGVSHNLPFLCKSSTETLPTPSASYFRPPSPINFCQNEPISLVKNEKLYDNQNNELPRVPIHPEISTLTAVETEMIIMNSSEAFPSLQQNQSKKSETSRREQRNYKNMTRERRIEANARERTRVHTISAAFETLRRSIPSYSHNQKLSKLSVLRIACSYIMTLSSIVNEDDNEPSTEDCVEMVSRTIQREGKLRKKKDDND